MNTSRIAVLISVLTAVALALPAQAADPRTGTLDCDNGETYTVAGQLFGNGYKIQDETKQPQNFIVSYLETPDGTVLVKHSPGKRRLGALACSYTIAGLGTAQVEGFLTPRR